MNFAPGGKPFRFLPAQHPSSCLLFGHNRTRDRCAHVVLSRNFELMKFESLDLKLFTVQNAAIPHWSANARVFYSQTARAGISDPTSPFSHEEGTHQLSNAARTQPRAEVVVESRSSRLLAVKSTAGCAVTNSRLADLGRPGLPDPIVVAGDRILLRFIGLKLPRVRQ